MMLLKLVHHVLLVIIVVAIQPHQLPCLLVVDRGVNQLICLGNVLMGHIVLLK